MKIEKNTNTFENPFQEIFWEEYIMDKSPAFRRRVQQIRNYLDEHPEHQGMTGERYQYDDKVSEGKNLYEYFGEKFSITLSWRSWGDLMAAYMNSKEGKKKYNYIDFYM